MPACYSIITVSYTHLDVYKRQTDDNSKFLNEPDIVKITKLGRLRWAGHVIRMGENEMPRKALTEPVSYTHLDVYKRQGLYKATI